QQYFFLVGAAGNSVSLCILHKTAKRRNRKHVFLLRCLAANDLLAQLGMLLLIHLTKQKVLPCHWSCIGFVLIRAFGLGSGCVALVMALDRWFALTRPFYYHQFIIMSHESPFKEIHKFASDVHLPILNWVSKFMKECQLGYKIERKLRLWKLRWS
ncbi:hypothetical protein NQ315_014986, partial [Exocentrus adspersus]